MTKHALVNHNSGTQYRCRVCGAVFDTDDKDANEPCEGGAKAEFLNWGKAHGLQNKS